MAVTVSELFTEYESDFIRIQASLEDQLVNAANLTDRRGSDVFKGIQRDLSEADQALRQMEMEAKTMPTDERLVLEPKLRQYRSSLSANRSKNQELKQGFDRRHLLNEGTVYGKPVEERERMLRANASMNSASSKLEEARRQAMEAEAVSVQIVGDLGVQRETMARTRANVGAAGTNYGMAKSVVEGMQRRADANRLLVRGICVFMVAILAGAVYLSFGGSVSTAAPTPGPGPGR